MSYSVSGLLASRMDAMIVGRRFIAGANGADKSRSPVRDGSRGGFQTRPYRHGLSRPCGGFSGVNEQSKRGK